MWHRRGWGGGGSMQLQQLMFFLPPDPRCLQQGTNSQQMEQQLGMNLESSLLGKVFAGVFYFATKAKVKAEIRWSGVNAGY